MTWYWEGIFLRERWNHDYSSWVDIYCFWFIAGRSSRLRSNQAHRNCGTVGYSCRKCSCFRVLVKRDMLKKVLLVYCMKRSLFWSHPWTGCRFWYCLCIFLTRIMYMQSLTLLVSQVIFLGFTSTRWSDVLQNIFFSPLLFPVLIVFKLTREVEKVHKISQWL